MDKNTYTTEEAADYLGVTVGRVRQMIVDGVLQTERFGRAHVIGKDALKTAEQRRTKPGPAPKSPATTDKRATARIRASNGASTGKKGKGKK
jgi:excisionase family DNA binding protein